MNNGSHRRQGMAAIQVVLIVVLMLLATVVPASAAYSNESATVNGGAGAAVVPGGSVTVSLTVTLTFGTDWRGTDWRWLDEDDAVVASGCQDTPNHEVNGTFTESFTLTAPATAGVYTLQVRAESASDCSSSTYSDRVNLNVGVFQEPATANPDLNAGCGLNIALVLDASGSIGNTNAQTVRNSVSSMLNDLSGTGSEVAIVEFATLADTPVLYTLVNSTNITNVFNPYLSTNFGDPGPQYYDGRASVCGGGTCYTNWDDALREVVALPTPPDLVLFFTDGEPNTIHNGSGGAATEYDAVMAAAAQAEIIKNNAGNGGDGSHIFAIGVGAINNSGKYANFAPITDGTGYLRFVTGAPGAGQTNDFSVADYFIGNFSDLETALTQVVTELCGGTITVTKLLDGNGVPGDAEDQTAQGWSFRVDATSPATVDLPNPETTDEDGIASFKIDFGPGQSTASLDVVEIGGYGGYNSGLVDASCTGATISNGTEDLANLLVDNIEMASNDVVTCIFINSVPNAVDLLSFEATGGKVVTLSWTTASEIDNLGFNLYGADSIDGPKTKLNDDLIPSLVAPGSPFGADYTHTDRDLKLRGTYYYWLEDVDIYGGTALHGPVELTIDKGPSLSATSE